MALFGNCHVRISDVKKSCVQISAWSGRKTSSTFRERVELFPRNTHLTNELHVLHLTTEPYINSGLCRLFKPASSMLRILHTAKILNFPGHPFVMNVLLHLVRTFSEVFPGSL